VLVGEGRVAYGASALPVDPWSTFLTLRRLTTGHDKPTASQVRARCGLNVRSRVKNGRIAVQR
jgi:hypothetical protein